MVIPEKAAQFLKLRIRAWDLAIVCGVILSLATLLGFAGSLWWVLDLFSHFRIQYFFGLLGMALLLLFPRRYKACAFFGAVSLINLSTIVPLYLGAEPQPAKTSQTYRGLLMNVNTETGSPEKVAAVIKELNPDIIALEEVNDRWLASLAVPLQAYPFSKAMPREDNFGIALYSRHPFVKSEILEIGEAGVPSVIAELELPSGRFTVIATHPLPPGGSEYSRLRNDQLASLPAVVKWATNSPVLLLGDLNATPWCPYFKRLLRESGLRDSSQGKGVLPSWPTYLPFMLIPIDHCLYTTGIYIQKKVLGPKTGSDHYPLAVDFILTSSP